MEVINQYYGDNIVSVEPDLATRPCRRKCQESDYPLYSSGEPSYPTRAVGGEDRGN